MSDGFATFDIANHVLSFGPIIIDSGLGKDVVFEFKRDSEAWDDEVGVTGDVTRSKNNDDRATIRMTMMQSSKLNDVLSTYYNLDKNTKGGLGGQPCALVDFGGSTKLGGPKAWLKASPDNSRGRKIGELVWVIRIAKAFEMHGGNDE